MWDYIIFVYGVYFVGFIFLAILCMPNKKGLPPNKGKRL